MIDSEESARLWLRSLPEYDDTARARLERLADLLADENQQQNLVSRSSMDGLWRRHIADSAQLLLHVPRETGPWLDLGTGAGFPGLVIAALRPDIPVVMVESRRRRIDWLHRAIDALELRCASVIGRRLELVETQPVGVISARAFAPLERILELSARFSTNQTVWLLPKGRSAQQELYDLKGWAHQFHVEESLTDPDAGIIVGRLQAPASSGRKGSKA